VYFDAERNIVSRSGILVSDQPTLTVDESREMLRTAGLRCTASRVAVLQHLSTADVPLSHADVSAVLVPQGYDKSTLYRCLVEMADAGLLSRLDLGDHAWRFELRESQQEDNSDHPHFMCVDCGKVSCLSEVSIQLPKGQETKIPGKVTEILLKGYCVECQ